MAWTGTMAGRNALEVPCLCRHYKVKVFLQCSRCKLVVFYRDRYDQYGGVDDMVRTRRWKRVFWPADYSHDPSDRKYNPTGMAALNNRLHGGARYLATATIAVHLLLIAVLVAACVPGSSGVGPQPTSSPGDFIAGMPRIGERAPNASLIDLDGNRLTIADFRGKPLIINFWATWCPPCRAEIPALNAVYQAYRDQGVEIVGIDYGEEADTVKGFLRDMDVSYRIVLDPDQEAADRYRVAALPTSLFVDREGIIRAVHLGGMDRQVIESNLAKILHGE